MRPDGIDALRYAPRRVWVRSRAWRGVPASETVAGLRHATFARWAGWSDPRARDFDRKFRHSGQCDTSLSSTGGPGSRGFRSAGPSGDVVVVGTMPGETPLTPSWPPVERLLDDLSDPGWRFRCR